MPLLQSDLAGRMAGHGLGEGSLQDSLALASFASLSTVETFREGPFTSLRASMLGRDAGIFRQGPDEPPEQNPGADTVPGNTGTAFVLTVGGAAQQGFVNTLNDEDWYRVELVAGQNYVFTANANGSGLDPYLELRDSTGALLAIDDDAGVAALDSLLRFTATTSGTYYINARAFPEQDSTGAYTLTAAIGPPQNPLDTIDYHYTVPTSSIQVYFATTGQTFGSGGAEATSLRSWTQAEMNAAMAALATFGQIAPLTFSTTLNQAEAEFTLVLADLEDNVLGWFAPTIGVGAFAPDTTSWTTPGSLSPGGSAFATLIHEFGHAFGLAHPHDNGGLAPGSEIMQGVIDAFGSFGTYQGVFTVMSYNDGSLTVGSTFTTGNPQTPMALDIALLLDRYGVNPTTGQGNTVYTIGAVNALRAIWDVNGTDTIVYTGANNATIDLHAATLLNEAGGGGFISRAQGVQSGFTIANGVTIENATGGSGDDTLIGNDTANTLSGGSGFDILHGNGGADRLVGGAGPDSLNGGAGVDTAVYTSLSTSATWVRNPNGNWSVSGDTLNSVEFLEFSDRDVFLDRAARTFSGNGTSDVLFRRDDGIMASWEVTGTTINQGSFLPTAPATWTVLGTGDVSGDGRDDVLWQRNDGLVYSWTMNGGAVSAAVGIAGLGAEWDFLGVGDFNGDLTDDLAWQRDDGIVFTWTMQNSALQSANSVTGLSSAWQIAGFGDFNGDGRDDFLWRNVNTGQSVVWHMDGSAIQSTGPTSVQTGLDWAVVGIGDTNRDGYDDIILQRASDGMIAVWAMNGTTAVATNVAAANPAQWTVHNIGDYNGDGREDILWQHDNGLVYVWLMNGASIQSAGALAGIGPEWGII